ncbi:Oxysterol-binding protein- protein 3 [Linnemannia hyalina]|uniref:Oxysterol-binding protein- protein 3 n=1 Tax=Linnemannia hyalina TaxID=64524 RepID=A0A9P8BUD4_9FUNG|nr:Oxysterol-binding protein- protein 3 [Linnemannia hyalina]
MQEIEVPPRDVFQHYVHVDQPGKTLVWWFSTKKKNISFGLYFRKNAFCPPQLKSTSIAPSITTTAPPHSSSAPTSAGGLQHQYQQQQQRAHPSRPESLASKNAAHSKGPSTGSGILSSSQKSIHNNMDGSNNNSNNSSSHISNNEAGQYSPSKTSANSSGSDEDLYEAGIGLRAHQHSPSQALLPSTTQPSLRKKKTVAKLKDPELIELIPIQHYESGAGPVHGEYTVQEEGSYVLVFDNTFSINTSKRLTFFVALEERGPTPVAQPTSEMTGWLLKKKRKRMQGWAKRWFQIDNGILSYSKVQHGPCRGKVHLVLSTVTVSKASNMIHIDSGTMLYHLKALTVEDYRAWMSVIKEFKESEHRAVQESVHRMTHRETPTPKRAHLSNTWLSSGSQLDALKELMSTMDAGFSDIQDQLESIRVKSGSTLTSQPKSTGRERQSSIDNKFKLPRFGIPRTTSDGNVSQTNDALHSQLQASFKKLAADKTKTFEMVRSEMEKWEKNEKQYQMLLAENDKLAQPHHHHHPHSLRNSGEKSALSRLALEEAFIAHGRTSMSSDRTNSLTSSIHTASDVFYDAMDDAVLTTNMSPADLSDLEDAGFDVNGFDDDDDNSSDEDEFVDGGDSSPSAAAAPVTQPAPPTAPEDDGGSIVRRSVLPAPVSGEDISLLSILRKNVGKDLSTVAMPVSLNEPINVLQKLCEELEYSELLDKAASLPGSLDRLVYVAAFAVSGYASSQWRAGRKPFNPLHGETFEYVCPEKGFKFISEKVSHYPPIMACHAESVHNWTLSMDSRAKTKFWGKSMELMPNGTIHIYFTKTNDHFTIVKPTTWMRNLMAGTKYLDHTGDMKITNHTTKETCLLTFKESSFFSGTKHELIGHVMAANGAKKRTLQGRWSESLMEEVGPNKLERLWKAHTPPPNHERYYGFTAFTMQLNELTKGLEKKLPRTDTRFRPDQSLFENGRVEEADQEKLRVEQKQRELRKLMESKGEPWEVKWFEKRPDPQTEDPEGQTWAYKGGYWEARESGQWNEKITLW